MITEQEQFYIKFHLTLWHYILSSHRLAMVILGQPSNAITTLQAELRRSFTLLMLSALVLYVSGGTYSLTSIPKDRFLRNFFIPGLFTLRVFARNLLRGGSCRRNIFHISFLMNDHMGYQLRVLISRHTTYYTTAT